MTLEQTLEKIKDFESLIDPREIDKLLFYVSAHKTDLIEELHQVDYQYSVRKLDLIKELGKVNRAKAQVDIEPVGQRKAQLEYQIKVLGEFKTNLRRRFELLTGEFR